MEDTFDYQLVPFNFVHCFNRGCLRRENCLCHLAALHAPKSTPYVMTVNPAAYPPNVDRCPHFKSAQKVRFAWGISAIFDNIVYKKALLLKRRIHALYPKTTYYRILNKERALSPAEQAGIAQIFVQNGITAVPVYDSYTEEYDWGNRNT